jgi:hypothetical protein
VIHPGSKIHADLDLNFNMENYLKVGTSRVKNIPTKVQNPKGRKTMFICKFWSFSMLPVPDPHSQFPGTSQINAELDPDLYYW